MSDPISVNNNQHSWGSITIKLRGSVFHGFTDVSFADARERVKAYGMGRHHAPRGRSRGKYTVENCKITGWVGSIQQLRQELAAVAGGKSYGDVEFQVIVQFYEDDDLPVTIELNRCVWAKNSSSMSEDADPRKEEIELDCMYILRNGLALFDQSAGSPAA